MQVRAVTAVAAGVEAEGAGAGEDEVEEDEAEEDRGVAAVQDREEALRRVRHPVGDRHLAGEQEGDRAGEEADQQQRAADQPRACRRSRSARTAPRFRPSIAAGKPKSFIVPCSMNSSAVDDAEHPEGVGRQLLELRVKEGLLRRGGGCRLARVPVGCSATVVLQRT